MSKNISISDEVYRRLKREKGDRSFSELIEARLDDEGRITDVAGQRVLDPEAADAASTEIRWLSNGTLARLDDETT